MNFLAHAVLSFGDPEILTGNMISDFVKGNLQYNYSPGIQRGIRLHRTIDRFTDLHPLTREAKKLLYPAAGPYAGALIDIVYDHFLALDEKEEPENGWHPFSQSVYAELHARSTTLPENFVRMLPYMTEHNWLYNYRHKQQIEQSFRGIARRARYFDAAEAAFRLFEDSYPEFEQHYQQFFPELKAFAINEHKQQEKS